MAQSEYREVKPGDWQGVRYAVNRANERLSKLDGFCGANNKYSDTTMMGNQILMGPARQQTANEDEFITKGYLRSKEAADIFSRSMGTGGVAPLVLTPSMPGGNTITGGGQYNPNTVIRGGDSNSGFADFSPESGLWMPQYTADTYSAMTFPGGKLKITSTANISTTIDRFIGVKSRFRIFPDENGLIEWEIRLVSVYWDYVSNSFPYGGWCFGVWPSTANSILGYIPGLGVGQNGLYSNSQARLVYVDNAINNTGTGGFRQGGHAIIGARPGGISIANRQQYKFSSTTPAGPRLITNQYWDVGTQTWLGWDREGYEEDMSTGIMNGFSVFIGHYQKYSTLNGMQMDEFRLNKGIAYLGASNDIV